MERAATWTGVRASARPRSVAYATLLAACVLVAALAALAAALIVGYAAWHAVRLLIRGDEAGAAKWATMTFAAGAPYLIAYGAGRGGMLARELLRGRTLALDVRAVAAPAAVIVVAIGFQAALASGSYFAGDDWLHLVLAHDVVARHALFAHGLDLSYLGRVVFIHYAPGHRFGYWLLERFAPLSWTAALCGLLALFGGSLVLLYLICRRLFGDRRSNLVLLLLFGTSILLVDSFLWFADGLHKLPSTFLSLLAIHCYLRWRSDGSRAALAASLAAMALGLLFYVKVLFVPLYLVLISVLFLERRPRRALRTLVAERWMWLAFLVPAGIYLWNYELSYAVYSGHHRPPLALVGRYLWTAWFRGVAPALGGVVVGLGSQAIVVLAAVLAQLALFAVVWLSFRRKRSAWRAWVFWLVAFAANAALVGFGRLASYGFARVGSDLRYDTEIAWLLPLALGFAFLPSEIAGRGAPEPRLRVRRRLTTALAAGGLVLYLAAATASGVGISSDWRAHQSGAPQAYVHNVRHDVAALGGAPRVIDDQTPAFIVSARDRPWNRLEHLLPVIAPHARVVVAGAHPLYVRGDGTIGPARLHPLGSGTAILNEVGSIRVRNARRVGRSCLAVGARSARITFTTTREMVGQSLYAAVTYDLLRPVRNTGVVADAQGLAGPDRFRLDERSATEVVGLGRDLRITLPPGVEACVRGVAVGWLGW